MQARIVTLSVALAACGGPGAASDTTTTPPPAPAPATGGAAYDEVPREDFNRLAVELALPLFWESDGDRDGAIDAPELAVVWGVSDTTRADWVAAGTLTPRFREAYDAVVARHRGSHTKQGDAREMERRKLVKQELAQGRPTLIRTRLAQPSAEDRAIIENILAAAAIVEDIHLDQLGSRELATELPAGDPASRMLFYRNQGPWCVAPETEGKEQCNAIPRLPPKISGLYPAELQTTKSFCEDLKKQPNAEKLRHQFYVVRARGKELEAVPYHEAYADRMKQVSAHLTAAAGAIKSPKEAAFKKYLTAAAKAFLDGSWEAADELWAAMSAQNSKYYLRIGPDEVYFEPCSLKAGFHVSFALINQESLAWQKRLDPVKGDMEKAFAELAGAPYKAREVAFKLPDFIDIIVNAGDSRSAHGATIGQSLPNWGKVAAQGGRTVAMTNLYTDPDSRREIQTQTASLLCKDSMRLFDSAREHQLLGTVLHEAAHNLGPAAEYRVRGKKATEIFGGPLASTLEELKAQTAALYFPDWLVERKVLTAEQAQKAHVRDIAWTFGHISRGMYTGDGQPKPYSQLSAIQVGFLQKESALAWRADEVAANGKDRGCMMLHLDRFPQAVGKLMRTVAGIKARGDKPAAQALVKDYVDVSGDQKALLDTIRERWLRAPKASFVYAIELE